jgi:hypothetical protein
LRITIPFYGGLAAMIALAGFTPPASAAIDQNQVLVVYNSENTDSQAVHDYYTNQPGRGGVLSLDLNDSSLNPGTVSYSDYTSKIRNPVRDYLNDNNLASQVTTITLTKGIPHRIDDTDGGNGDSPSNASSEFNNGDATFASVDSELTLLQQDLGAGESGGEMDSPADNLIENPYHTSNASIDSFDRSSVAESKAFSPDASDTYQTMKDTNAGGIATTDATAGSMYLTTRLDGRTVQQVKDAIDRAQNIEYNRLTDQILLDENDNRQSNGSELDDQAFFSTKSSDPGYAGNDYDEAASQLSGNYDSVTFDQAKAFLRGESSPFNLSPDELTVEGRIAMLASFGTNHDSDLNGEDNYSDTFQGQLVDGAIFNSLESFSGRAFGGLGDKNQEQLADWLANGGTLGTGNVFEPFAATLPDNEFIVENFILGDLTWAEAAWSSTPWLSWQQLVVGDPLARADVVVPEPHSALLLAGGSLVFGVCGRNRRRSG